MTERLFLIQNKVTASKTKLKNQQRKCQSISANYSLKIRNWTEMNLFVKFKKMNHTTYLLKLDHKNIQFVDKCGLE